MQATEAELKALMLRSLDGDAAAYRRLLSALRERLAAYYARRLGPGAAEAEDLVQDTLIAVHSRRASYDPGQPFTAWAYAIARYRLIDHYRRTKVRAAVPLEDALEALTVEGGAEAAGARMDVDRLLGGLTPRAEALVRRSKLDGLSTAEIAGETGLSDSAIKVAVHRGLKALAARVKGDGR